MGGLCAKSTELEQTAPGSIELDKRWATETAQSPIWIEGSSAPVSQWVDEPIG